MPTTSRIQSAAKRAAEPLAQSSVTGCAGYVLLARGGNTNKNQSSNQIYLKNDLDELSLHGCECSGCSALGRCSVALNSPRIQRVIAIGQCLHNQYIISVRHIKLHTSLTIKPSITAFSGVKAITRPSIPVFVLKQRSATHLRRVSPRESNNSVSHKMEN